MSTPRLLAALLLAYLGALRAAEPEWQVTLDWQIISVPAEAALRILPKTMRSETADAGVALLQKQVAEGTAEVIAQPRVVLHPTEPEASATQVEHRYAIEYTEPILPMIFGGGPTFASLYGFSEALPTTFETRKLGEFLDANGSVAENGRRVQMRVSLQRCVFPGTWKMNGGKTAGGVAGNVEQPRFLVHTCQSAFALPSGKWQFAAAFPATENGPCEFFLLRATAKRLSPLAPKKP